MDGNKMKIQPAVSSSWSEVTQWLGDICVTTGVNEHTWKSMDDATKQLFLDDSARAGARDELALLREFEGRVRESFGAQRYFGVAVRVDAAIEWLDQQRKAQPQGST